MLAEKRNNLAGGRAQVIWHYRPNAYFELTMCAADAIVVLTYFSAGEVWMRACGPEQRPDAFVYHQFYRPTTSVFILLPDEPNFMMLFFAGVV